MAQIEHISDTARWVAFYRAMETERPDAIFRDPFAAKLAGERGEAIVDAMKLGRAMAWAMIVRTKVFDEIVLDHVRGGGVDLVLNLAAGLDARAWRMPLPLTLRWVDVDLPDILEYKMELLRDNQPVCKYEPVPLDLRDPAKRRALFTQLGTESERALIVTEGLLMYLTAEQVGALADDLHRPASFRWWSIDLWNRRLLVIMQRYWGRNVQAGNAPFQFAPAEGTKFFERHGWREVLYRSINDEGRRLHREMRMMWLWRALMTFRSKKVKEEFRRFSGAVLLERI